MREISLGRNAKRIFGSVSFSRIINNYENGGVVHLTQGVKSIYPKRLLDTGFGPGLYDSSYSEYETTRNCLVRIPEGLTEADVNERLQLFDGHIYLIVSNNIHDIITAFDTYRVEMCGTQLYEIEDKYETKDKEGNMYSKGLIRCTWDGEVIRDLPKEFRRYIYSREYRDDIDLREVEEESIIKESNINYNIKI
jgi:hypothetical protein